MSKRPQMDDYVDVAERLVEFREKHGEGSLQQVSVEFREFAGQHWVIYTAAAYRNPDDTRPGIGTAWEPVPGRTPFTKDSELQNAETSAWGRAIVAALAADTKRGIASAQEVNARQNTKPSVQPRSGAVAADKGEGGRPPVDEPPPSPPDLQADGTSGEGEPSAWTMSAKQRARLQALRGEAGLEHEELKAGLYKKYGHTSTSQLTREQYDTVTKALEDFNLRSRYVDYCQQAHRELAADLEAAEAEGVAV